MNPAERLPIAFRADDAGAFPGMTAGILDAVRAGCVKNVSVMVPPPHFADAARELAALPEDIEIGLHVTLNCEWLGLRWRPLAPPDDIPDLVDAEGYFRFRTPHEIHAAAVPVRQMMAEVRAQLAALRSSGLRPTYLDEHMGVGWVCDGAFHRELLKLCAEERLIHADELPRPRLDSLAEATPGSLVVLHLAKATQDIHGLRCAPGDDPDAVLQERSAELELLLRSKIFSMVSSIGLSESARIFFRQGG